ncbi:MAG: cytochrome c oxidase subunit II [Alphaproteobacteria bacterium]
MQKFLFSILVASLVAPPAMAQIFDGLTNAKEIPKNITPWQMGLTGAASQVAEQVQWFHNWVLMPLIIVICVFVLLLLLVVIFRFSEKKNPVPSKVSHNTALEIIWTAIPLLILGVMFIPSIKILYFMESSGPSDMTVKAVGHQWYWSYEYTDIKKFTIRDVDVDIDTTPKIVRYDSILVPKDDLPTNQQHLYRLKVDKPLYIPVNRRVKIILTSQDVVHSFSVLPLGLKMDAIPGRNNETWVTATATGVYYGFCTELCGAGHSFMPIEVRVVSENEFQNWLNDGDPFATPNVGEQQSL